jgi:hypothetical protein
MTCNPAKPEAASSPRLAVLTSVETRHRHFARALCRSGRVRAVLYAPPAYMPAAVDAADLDPRDRAVVIEHFTERARQEEAFFGHDADWVESSSTCRVFRVEPGRMNTPQTAAWLAGCGVDTVLVFGTDLIKPPLLEPARRRMINMHLGLSPYYRGTATNFYPLLNGEPELVGATIHLIDAGIDTGPILQHARPAIVAEDRPHTIGCKAIAAGIAAMASVVQRLRAGEPLIGVPQWKDPRARVYLRRDYHPRQVVELYRKWETLVGGYFQKGPQHDPLLIGDPSYFSGEPSPAGLATTTGSG